MRRQLLSLAAVLVSGGLFATPSASAQQSVNFFAGAFVPTPLDARGTGNGRDDILVKDLDVFAYNFRRFDGFTFGGEYLFGFGDFFEAGASVGYYQSTAQAADINFVNTNGSNINADLKLRTVPFNATFRFLPVGHRAPIVPYIGGGVAVIGWRYSESGQFVDYPLTGPVPKNPAIFNATFSDSGTAIGPVILGGVRFPIGPLVPGFEVRWQKATGNLNTDPATGFAAPHIDLGGFNYLFTFAIRF
jgi:hypothetical protein